LQAEEVPVPAGDVGDDLDADLLLDFVCQGDVPHAYPCQGVFGDIYGIGPGLAQQPCTADDLVAAEPFGGVQFDGDDRALSPVGEKSLLGRFLTERRGQLHPRNLYAEPLRRSPLQADGELTDMLRGCAAAAADDRRAGSCHFGTLFGKVFRGRPVDITSVKVFGKARVGKGGKWPLRCRGHPSDGKKDFPRAGAAVRPDDVRPGSGKHGSGRCRIHAAAGPLPFQVGHAGDDRQAGLLSRGKGAENLLRV